MLTLLLTLSAAAEPVVHRLADRFTNVYAIVDEGGVVLIDAHYPEGEAWITASLAELGIALSDVRLVVLTHGHPDHAGSAAALQAAGIPVAIGAGDVAMAAGQDSGPPKPTGLRGRLILPIIDPQYPTFTPDVVIEDVLDLSAYGVAGQAERVGGHSAGSVAVVLPDGRVFVGDLIRSHMVRQTRPTLHFFHDDTDAAHGSLTELLDAGAVEILPGHGGPMTASRVRRWLERHR